MTPLTTPEQRLIAQASRKEQLEPWETCTDTEFISKWLPLFDAKSAMWTAEIGNSEHAIEDGFHAACCALDRLQSAGEHASVQPGEHTTEIDPATVRTELVQPEPTMQPARSYQHTGQRWLSKAREFLTAHRPQATTEEMADALGVKSADRTRFRVALHGAAESGSLRKAGYVMSGKGRSKVIWALGENNDRKQEIGQSNGDNGGNDDTVLHFVQPTARYEQRRPAKYG